MTANERIIRACYALLALCSLVALACAAPVMWGAYTHGVSTVVSTVTHAAQGAADKGLSVVRTHKGTEYDRLMHARAWKACATEDSVNCRWDARMQGNGKGVSFIAVQKGSVVKVFRADGRNSTYAA